MYYTTIYKLLTLLSMFLMCCNAPDNKLTPATLPVERSDFQTTIQGKKTDLYILKNKNGMKIAITNYGGRIVSLMVPDKKGNFDDIVLGFSSIKDYLNANEIYFGALIGRYANRIDEGTFTLNGTRYELPTNNGQNHLHGGPGGFHNVVWYANQLDNQHLVLQYISKDGDEGYPGRLNVQVIYVLTDQNELKIYYSATTNKPTIVNLTNHAFFNLAGAGSGTINNHKVKIPATYFTPVDSTLIPTGNIKPVEDTPFDFRELTRIGERLNQQSKQLEYGGGYDHNFALDKNQENSLTLAARVVEPQSGRVMEIKTTEPGIQFYGGNFLDGSDVGKEGVPYSHRSAFCLEPQHFPDSPNQKQFPDVVLNPEEIYQSLSIYTFSTTETLE